jgi:hypothetical protein
MGQRGVVHRRLGRLLAPAVVAKRDPACVQLLVETAEIALLEFQRLRELIYLAEFKAAAILAAVDQRG